MINVEIQFYNFITLFNQLKYICMCIGLVVLTQSQI